MARTEPGPTEASLAELVDRVSAVPPTPDPAAVQTSASDRSRRPCVLLADDDDVIARAVQAALRLDQIEVVHARDGEEAIQLARALDIDLVLLDIQMPVTDGFGVCRTLRADPRLATVPIVMLTAQSDRERVQASFAEGATDYIVKPFSVSQLRARVRTWLMRSTEAQA